MMLCKRVMLAGKRRKNVRTSLDQALLFREGFGVRAMSVVEQLRPAFSRRPIGSAPLCRGGFRTNLEILQLPVLV